MNRRYTLLAVLVIVLIALGFLVAYSYFHPRASATRADVTNENPSVITDAQGNSVSNANEVTKDLQTDYGSVSSTTINQAISDAKAYFAKSPDTLYIIQIPAGTFTMDGTIDVSGVHPGPGGRLVIEGAGSNSTTIVQSGAVDGIRGMKTYRTSFIGIHFTVPYQTTTQGVVVSDSPGKVTVSVPPGFPTPLQVMNTSLDLSQACPYSSTWGRYLKNYTASATDPQITDVNQPQVPWCKPVAVAGTTTEWNILIKNQTFVPPYPIGTLVAIKSKNLANTYYFCGGDDFVFKDIAWTEESRGIWRCGFNNVMLDHDAILRGPPINGQVPVVSSPAGGPQFGDSNGASGGYIVKDSYFEATGDDAIAFFNATGTVENTQVYDASGRVLLYNSPLVQLINDTIVRTRIVTSTTTGATN